MKWKITFYSGKIENQTLSFPAGILANFLHIAEMIEKLGPNLGKPYVGSIGSGLFEIRAKGKEGIGHSMYCTVKGREIVILHSFIKKTQKTPKKDLDLAKKRMKEVLKMSRPTLSEFKTKALAKASVRVEYESLRVAYNLRRKLIELRQQAGLTQEEIAAILHTQKSNISRLENANSINSPKLSTIEQYAHAVGYDIEINFVPMNKPS